MMEITLKPRLGIFTDHKTGKHVKRDSGIDYVTCDGKHIGYLGRNPKDPVQLIGIPSEALIAALREKFPNNGLVAPSVLLNKDGDPVGQYGDGDNDEDEMEEDDD